MYMMQALDNNSIMVFLKHFSVSEQTLKGVSKVYVQWNSKLSELIGTVNALMGCLRPYEVRFHSLPWGSSLKCAVGNNTRDHISNHLHRANINYIHNSHNAIITRQIEVRELTL